MRSAALVMVLAASAAAAAPASEGWIGAVSQGIREGEYHLSPKEGAEGWTAPNREQDLRAWWHDGALEVTPRVEGDAWRLTYRLASVGRSREARVADVTFERVDAGRLEWQRDGLVEWYANDARGIEQGFTLETRPPGEASEPIVIEGLISGLLAFPADDGSSILLRTAAGRDALRIRDLSVRDANGVELASCLSVTTGALQIWLDDRDAVYPVTVDPLLTSPSWTAESDQAGASFGFSVATAGDVNGDGYSDVVVGAYQYDAGQPDEGRVFEYHGSASGLGAVAAWTAESDQASSQFGRSVATAGDVNGDGYSDVVIGVPAFDDGEANEGRATLHLGSPSGLSAMPAWTAEDDQVGASLGYSVAAAGDVNGDGFSDVIVGAPFFDGAFANEGGVALYLGASTGLAPVPAWSAESGQASSLFGESVSTAGDVNGDGLADVIVGASAFDNGESAEGRAFVYHGASTGLAPLPAWTAESDQANANLGARVSTAGDVNGDGFADVVVGAASYDAGESDEGRALVFQGSPTGLSPTPAWSAEGNQVFAQFGSGVASAGDVDDDGYGDVIIGAYLYDNGETDEGRVFLYRGSASGLSATSAWTAEGDQPSAWLGLCVAAAGDVNGDGWSDVIVGAHGWDGGQSDEGRAYVYNGSPSGPATTAAWTADGDQDHVHFGMSVATAGDVNGDGFSDVIVGADFYDNTTLNEGAAFVYAGSASGLSTNPAWVAYGRQEFAQFGTSVATAGDVNGDGYSDVIVGAILYDRGQDAEGRAFVFLGSASGLAPSAAWTGESDERWAYYGRSVATAGDVNGDGYSDVIVGADQPDHSLNQAGRAYVYHGSASGLAATPAWIADGAQPLAGFGYSVASAGDVNGDGYSDVIVGAHFDSNGEAVEGRAFVYHGSPTGLASSPVWTAESDQATGRFGDSVASAGDVNGDGYSDVIVAAGGFDDGEMEEGRSYLYYGSASGLAASPAWIADGNQEDAYFGWCVATAGDLNGDGYSDVIVGAPFFDNGESSEGRASVYHGSPSGLAPSPAWTTESNQAGADLGFSVAMAGDVNGDGYSDVIVGARLYETGQVSEGRAFVYYGNDGDGLDRIARQRRADDSAPIDILGAATEAAGFRVAANGRSPYGRDRVRLEIEVKPLGTPFDGVGIETTPFTDTGLPGPEGSVVPLSLLHAPLPPGPHHWRARLRGTSPFPWQSHWMSPPYNCQTETDLRAVTRCDPAACDDGDACNGVETCDPATGACAAGTPVVCDDGDACNGIEACDPATGACVAGTPVTCDDGDACNGIETCDPSTGACVAGTPVVCDDGDACNGLETCDPATGTCPPGTPVLCDDGDACNGIETCDPATGGCAGGTPVVCDDGDPCNGIETCDAATGACGPGPVVDSDGDGVGDDCGDCAPLDDGAFAIPVEASLRVSRPAGSSDALVAWLDLAANAGSGTRYDVASDLLSALHAARSANGPCVATGLASLTWQDARGVAGDGFYYLARGVNACGPPAGEGWGADSLGVARPACP